MTEKRNVKPPFGDTGLAAACFAALILCLAPAVFAADADNPFEQPQTAPVAEEALPVAPEGPPTEAPIPNQPMPGLPFGAPPAAPVNPPSQNPFEFPGAAPIAPTPADTAPAANPFAPPAPDAPSQTATDDPFNQVFGEGVTAQAPAIEDTAPEQASGAAGTAGATARAQSQSTMPLSAEELKAISELRWALAEQRYSQIPMLVESSRAALPDSMEDFFTGIASVRTSTIEERQTLGHVFLAQFSGTTVEEYQQTVVADVGQTPAPATPELPLTQPTPFDVANVPPGGQPTPVVETPIAPGGAAPEPAMPAPTPIQTQAGSGSGWKRFVKPAAYIAGGAIALLAVAFVFIRRRRKSEADVFEEALGARGAAAGLAVAQPPGDDFALSGMDDLGLGETETGVDESPVAEGEEESDLREDTFPDLEEDFQVEGAPTPTGSLPGASDDAPTQMALETPLGDEDSESPSKEDSTGVDSLLSFIGAGAEEDSDGLAGAETSIESMEDTHRDGESTTSDTDTGALDLKDLDLSGISEPAPRDQSQTAEFNKQFEELMFAPPSAEDTIEVAEQTGDQTGLHAGAAPKTEESTDSAYDSVDLGPLTDTSETQGSATMAGKPVNPEETTDPELALEDTDHERGFGGTEDDEETFLSPPTIDLDFESEGLIAAPSAKALDEETDPSSMDVEDVEETEPSSFPMEGEPADELHLEETEPARARMRARAADQALSDTEMEGAGTDTDSGRMPEEAETQVEGRRPSSQIDTPLESPPPTDYDENAPVERRADALFHEQMKKGDQAMADGDYEQAVYYYEVAAALKRDAREALDKLRIARSRLETRGDH